MTQERISKPYVATPFECGWCFNKLRKYRIPALGFVFCSSKCFLRFKEFESIFRK